MEKVLLTIATIFAAGFLAGCPDDDCNDCSCDPSLCDGGGDADADADSDGDVPPQYGNLTVTSTPLQGAAIELDGDPSGQVTDHLFENLVTGAHSVLLSLAGRLVVSDAGELGQPTEVNLATEGTAVNIVLYYDLTGRWKQVESNGAPIDGPEYDMEMVHRNTVPSGISPTNACPETSVVVHGFDPANFLCVEADETLSLCKTHASECGDLSIEGRILDNGRRVEYTKHQLGVDYSAVFTKMD